MKEKKIAYLILLIFNFIINIKNKLAHNHDKESGLKMIKKINNNNNNNLIIILLLYS